MQRGDQGSAVRALQEALMELGYGLPRWGADSSLGAETIDALSELLSDHGMRDLDGENLVSRAELELVEKLLMAKRSAPQGPALSDGKFHDLRSGANQDKVGGRRRWAQITGITLHQTAVELGERPDRWKTLGAHLGVTREGQVMWLHGFEKIVWHANGFNNRTVGIEMDGMYEGVEGDLKTFWRPSSDPDRKPQRPTPSLIDAAKKTVRWVCQEVERHGGKVQHLLAHRQASEDRQSDPGSALWQAVGMEMHRELGLDDGGAGFTDGSGLPIPEAWNSSRKGVRY